MKPIQTAALTLLLLAASSANARDWGVRAAFDINIPSKIGGRLEGAPALDMYRMGYGGTVGVVYDHWFSDAVFLEPGASLFYDSYSYKDLIITGASGQTLQKDPSLYKFGVRVPVAIGYSYYLFDNLPMRVYTGPEFSYAFAGDIRLKHSISDFEDIHLFGKDGDQRRFDAAWKIGLAADLDYAILGIDVAIGMTDLYPGHLTFRENRLSISLTRFF